MKIENESILKSKGGDAMVLQAVEAKGRLSGMLFELSVQQRYKNPAERNVEVVYTFPLPWGAILLGLEVAMSGKVLTGVVVEKKLAEERYEEAIAEGDSPIMVERAADGLYTVNLGNLLAGEEATVSYRYAQLLQIEQGRLRLAIPTTIAPRYGDPRASGMQSHQIPGHSLAVEYPFSIQIDIDASLSTARVSSASHRIEVGTTGTGTRVSLAQSAYLDRDFVLTLDGLPSLSAASVAVDGDQHAVLASFCPLAEQASDDSQPCALKLVIDC